MQRRRRQRERQKRNSLRLAKQQRFFVHFVAVTTRLRRENA